MINRKHITGSVSFLFAWLLCGTATAQIKIINASSKNADADHLFIGIYNRIVVSGIADKNITLKARYGEITKGSNTGEFAYHSSKVTDQETLTVTSKGKIVATRQFKMDNIPIPKAQLGTITDSFVRPTDIIAHRRLIVVLPGCDYNLITRISSFSMTIFSANIEGGKKYLQVEVNDIPEQAFPFIKKLQGGDRILFDHMIMLCPSSRPRGLAPLTLWIK